MITTIRQWPRLGWCFVLGVVSIFTGLAHATEGPRARDLGIPFDGEPGPHNAITDVAGVEVGYATLIRGDGELVIGEGPVRTGVTAIHPRGRTDVPMAARSSSSWRRTRR